MTKYRSRSPFLSGLLSVVMPGLGHMYTGRGMRGVAFFCLSIVASAIAPVLGIVPYPPINIAAMVVVFSSVYVFTIIDSVRIAGPLRYGYVLKGYNKWYLYFGVYIFGIVVVTPVSGIIRTFLVQSYRIPAGSMEPTLLVGDYILVNKFNYRNGVPKRGDVIVFVYPPDPTKDFVKRVVGVPGDEVEVRNDRLIINGQEQTESYAKYGPDKAVTGGSFGPTRVPENSLFVLGDNRNHSYDSRFWGCVEMSKVKGKVANVYWSWDATRFSGRWDRIGKEIK